MSRSKLDSGRIVGLLMQDAVPTLGERARTEVLRLGNYEELARAWMQTGESLAQAQRDFDRSVVDGLQQTAHDLFWDTTWPACPSHPQHPLWYDDEREAWCCESDESICVSLGRLTHIRSPAT